MVDTARVNLDSHDRTSRLRQQGRAIALATCDIDDVEAAHKHASQQITMQMLIFDLTGHGRRHALTAERQCDLRPFEREDLTHR